MRLIPLVILLLAVSGCAKKVEVQSDGCWHGFIGGNRHDGCNNSTFALKGQPKCAKFVFKDNGTFLKARVKGGAWAETRVHFDSITVCQ